MWHWCNLAAKDSGLKSACVNNDSFTVRISGGSRHPLSEHVSCVVVTFKMTEWVEWWICIKFCVKLEHSSTETIWMIQKATAMGNWCLAASARQHAQSRITSPTEFFGKTSNHPGELDPHTPWIWHHATYGFSPKLKSSLKGKRFQTINEIQENRMGLLMVIRRTMWGVF